MRDASLRKSVTNARMRSEFNAFNSCIRGKRPKSIRGRGRTPQFAAPQSYIFYGYEAGKRKLPEMRGKYTRLSEKKTTKSVISLVV